MSLLSLIGTPREVAPERYDGPTSAPYNADNFITFYDPYGTNGSGVHFDVLDFGARGWRGHRFWMTFTPYHNKNIRYENPCVYYADTPTRFVPAGHNPIYPAPPDPSQWNSDTELLHDPASDELILMFRDGTFTPNIARSTDGTTWPAAPTVVPWPGVTEEVLSPTYVHDGTQWVAWGIQHDTRTIWRWTAPAPEGPWSSPVACTGFNSSIWHFNIILTPAGRYLCIYHLHAGRAYAASSSDGITWTTNPDSVLTPRGSGYWDGGDMYRSALTLHEDGDRVRVWYAGQGDGSDSYRCGYTQIPLTEFP